MNTKELAKKAAKGAALMTILSAIPVVASAQEDSKKEVIDLSASSLEWHFTQGGADKARINLFYNLPLKTRGYSFMEFYGPAGYFGKDMLNTELLKKAGIDLKTETKHALFVQPEGENISFNTVGFGLEKGVALPGNAFIAAKFLPAVFGKGGYQKNNMILGYFASKAIPINDNLRVNISSFLDFNIADKNGPLCDYGETDVTLEHKTRYGQFDYGVGFNHNVSGEFAPDNQFRARIGYHIRK